MDIQKVADGSDIQLTITMPTIDGQTFQADREPWEMELWVFTNKRVKVRYNTDTKQVESIGEIQTNGTAGSVVTLYIKSSETPFGKGLLKGQMTLFKESNGKFKNDEQVIKTLEMNLNIQIA